MEIFLVILMVFGIFIVIPAIIGLIVIGVLSGLTTVMRDRLKVTRGLKLLGTRGFHLTMMGLLLLYYPIIYYFGELIDHFGWEALRWDFFYTVHDIHRVFFLIPIVYASYCFRIKGAVITTIFALAVFLPRGFLLSEYPDPIGRMVVFVIFACGLGIFIGILRNQYERLQQFIASGKK